MNAFAPVRTVPPSAELVPLADAKAYPRVESDDDDALVAGIVAAAIDHFDGYAGILGQALLEQTWAQSFDCFPGSRCLRLPLGPLFGADLVTIAYFDAAGAAQTFTAFQAATDAIGPLLILNDAASWPNTAARPDAVTATWTCGFGASAAAVPASIVHAVKLLVTHWYENRGAVAIGTISGDLAWSLDQLIAPHRKVGL